MSTDERVNEPSGAWYVTIALSKTSISLVITPIIERDDSTHLLCIDDIIE